MVISRKYKVIFFWIFLVLVFILTLKNDLISNYNTKSVNVHRDYEVNSHNLTALEDLLQCQENRLRHLRAKCFGKGINSNLSSFDLQSLTRETALYILDDPHKVILRAIPKTGISSWKTILINNSVNRVNKDGPIKQWDWGLIKTKYGLKVLPDERDLNSMLFKLTHYFNILTVRHPLDRLESGFWDRIWTHAGAQNKSDLSQASQRFGQFLKAIKRHLNDGHFKPIYRTTVPCAIPFSFITKLETCNMEMEYIVHKKLSGRGNSVRRNGFSKRTSSQKTNVGKILPLFSGLPNPREAIDMLMSIYGTDMELFGYTYRIDNGNVIALCENYNDHNMCC